MPCGLAGVLTNMRKPMLGDYYSGSQTLKQLEDDLQQSIQLEKKGYICDEAYIIIISFIVGVIYSAYNIESVGLGLFFLPVGFAMASVILLVTIRPLKLFYSEHTNFSTHKIEQIQTNIKQIKQYESDLIKWENYNTETGIGYWLSLRGELLEQAVALLLQRQNWKVETTKRSGDGGVDLILRKRNSDPILVQCKGHAQKIGVGPVRDAAGVKSVSGSEFILIGPSGFTSGAFDFALQTGIELWDAHKLVEIANSGYDREM